MRLGTAGSVDPALRRNPIRRVRIHLTAIVALLATAIALRAHTPGTSYCKIAIGHEAVTFTLIYDVATLMKIAPLDANRDQRITPGELSAATPAIEAFLRRTVFIELNEREASFGSLAPPTWAAGDAIAASEFEQRLVTFKFQNEVLHAPDSVAITFDFFGALGERHTVLGNFIWNRQENPLVFTRFEPDYFFSTGYQVPALTQFRQYLWLGVHHIFRGYDHIAFLLALLFVRRFADVVRIVTAFTLAHTVTLVLAALGIVSLPARLVESAIAASIVYVAAENLLRQGEPARRWLVALGFGLVHGFGFATILRELGLPNEGLVRSLLAFNLGVELGQLVIAAACWPVIAWLNTRPSARRSRVIVSGLLLAFGAAWLIDRAFAIGFMPL